MAHFELGTQEYDANGHPVCPGCALLLDAEAQQHRAREAVARAAEAAHDMGESGHELQRFPDEMLNELGLEHPYRAGHRHRSFWKQLAMVAFVAVLAALASLLEGCGLR